MYERFSSGATPANLLVASSVFLPCPDIVLRHNPPLLTGVSAAGWSSHPVVPAVLSPRPAAQTHCSADTASTGPVNTKVRGHSRDYRTSESRTLYLRTNISVQ